MAATVSAYLGTVLRWAWQDLQPFEGRFEMAWRVAALCSLAVLVFMTYGIPLAAIGCYLILYLMKPDAVESGLMAAGLSVVIGIAVITLIYLAQWTVDAPWLRLVVILVGSFTFVYLGAASQIGPEGNVVALVFGFAMTLIGDVPNGEIATRAILYAGLMAFTPMALIIGFSLFLGRSPLRLLRQALARRLTAAANAFETPENAAEARQLALDGNATLDKWAGFVRLLHLCPNNETRYLQEAVDNSYVLLLASQTVATETPDKAQRRHLAEACRQLAGQITAGAVPPQTIATTNPQPAATLAATTDTPPVAGTTHPTSNGPAQTSALDSASAAIERLQSGAAGLPRQKEKQPFFHPDALSNPVYQHFALKTTAAATISYLIYTALDWQGIHTAMITCYVAALGTTAETLHKLTLRIIGCLIGAAFGVGSILFLFPYMTSIGSLMLLVFIVILIAGWVSSGSERIAYAGIQIGLAFLLTVVQGFGPDLHLSAASDRIMGILLGNLVTYLVFTRVWPLSVVSVARQSLGGVLEQLRQITQRFERGQPDFAGLASATKSLADTHEQLELSLYEPRALRPGDDTIRRLQSLTAKAEALCTQIAFEQNKTATLDKKINQLQDTLNASPAA